MRAALLIALPLALALAGCTSQTPGATQTTPATSGSGYAFGVAFHHDAATPSGPRAFVMNGSYEPGTKAVLFTYVHGPLDDTWSLALRDGWHLAKDGAGWRINATLVEVRLGQQSFHTTPASADFVLTGALPDGHYAVSVLCVIDDHGRDEPCTAPEPVSFDVSGGKLAA